MHHVIQRVGCSGVSIHLLLMVYHKNHFISLHPSLYPTHFSSLSILCTITRRKNNGVQASTSESAPSAASTIAVDNFDSNHYTVFVIRARNRLGLLQVITRVLKPTAREMPPLPEIQSETAPSSPINPSLTSRWRWRPPAT